MKEHKMIVGINEMLQVLEQYKKQFTSTKFENLLGLFLPSKNITKSRIYKEFIENNQQYVLREDLFIKVTITGRFLTQKHKDILESLFANLQGNGIFNLYKDKGICQIIISPYKLKKSYISLSNGNTNTQWLYEKLKEIANCAIELEFKETNEKFVFSFIDSIFQQQDKTIVINFSQSYTYFLAKTLLLEYKDYVKPLLEFNEIYKSDF